MEEGLIAVTEAGLPAFLVSRETALRLRRWGGRSVVALKLISAPSGIVPRASESASGYKSVRKLRIHFQADGDDMLRTHLKSRAGITATV